MSDADEPRRPDYATGHTVIDVPADEQPLDRSAVARNWGLPDWLLDGRPWVSNLGPAPRFWPASRALPQ